MPGLRSGKLTFASKLYRSYGRWLGRWPALPSDRPYNITVCHERRFLWYRVAKVCTRSIFAAFDQEGLKLDVDQAIQCYYPPRSYRDYFKFAFVRNPWSRLASCWQHKVLDANYFRLRPEIHKDLQAFPNFVDWVSKRNLERCDRHFRLQCTLIDLNHVDFVGRFETFETDFRTVATRIDLPVGKLPHKNATGSGSRLADVYDGETIKLVAKLYARDIALFGYRDHAPDQPAVVP